MKQLKNKKGMTLIEIVVVLLMMSILLVVVGSLILNSFNYFDKTSNQDASKRTLDSVSDFVRSELLYASDVRIAETKPNEEDWKVFYVKDKRLYHNDQALYSEGFYNRKNLEMEIRGYDSYRLDINYALFDSENEKTYSTKDTLELLNLKITAEADKTFNPFTNISTMITISETNKIYYQEGMKPIEDDPKPEDPTEGTLADQMRCLTLHNNRLEYDKTSIYRVGDMTYKDGYWWALLHDSGARVEPGVEEAWQIKWKRMDAYYYEYSLYSKGDVVMDAVTGQYYECILNTVNGRITNPTYLNTNKESDEKSYWKKIDKPEKSSLCNFVITPEPHEKSPIYELENLIHPKDNKPVFNLEDIPEYDAANNYSQVDTATKSDDFVKVYDDTLKIYRYFIKRGPGHSNTSPLDPVSGFNEKLIWQEMCIDYKPNSYYQKGDVVLAVQWNNSAYFEAINVIDNNKDTELILDDGNLNTKYWKKLDK